MKKLLLLLSIIVVLPLVFNSCRVKPDNFKLSSISATSQRITGIYKDPQFQRETFIAENIENSNDTTAIRYDSLGFEVIADYVLTVSNSPEFQFGIKTAFGWSKMIIHEKVSEIILMSNKNFNDDYPAGSDLTNLFNAHVDHGVDKNTIFELQRDFGSYTCFCILFFTLKEPPEIEEVHTFTIHYITENGDTLMAFVPNILIKK